MMDDRTQSIVVECRRQQESCLYTSTALFEWVKSLRLQKIVFVVTPIILGAVATMPLLADRKDLEWLTGVCAVLAGIIPAVYKALDLDISLGTVIKSAHAFKALHDRFRQAAEIDAQGPFEDLKIRFDDLTKQMDAARAESAISPDRFFDKARRKIEKGDYNFAVDAPAKEDGSS